MNFNQFSKIALVALLATQSFWAVAQTNNAAAPVDYSTFVKFVSDRNIFDPDRVPNVPWKKPTQRLVGTTPQTPQPDSFSLVGIIGYDKGRLAGAYAFFDGNSSQYRRTVQLNGSIANFKVADIAADSVTLLTDTNSRIVLRIGEQLHDDGSGHWLTANGNGVTYNNTSANGRYGNRNSYGNGGRRSRNYLGGGNNGSFGRNRNYYQTRSPAAGNSQSQDQNMDTQYDNAAPDMTPPDDNAPPDADQQNN